MKEKIDVLYYRKNIWQIQNPDLVRVSSPVIHFF